MRVYANRERNAAILVVVTISMLAVVMGGASCARSQPAMSSHNADNGSTASSTPTVCIPSDVEVSKPLVEYSPMPTAQGACSQTALDGLFDACFEPSGNCTAWKTANSACAQCVFTPDSATVQGPFITRNNAIPKANQRGCLDSLAPGCGTAYESVTACTHAACDSNAECKSATSAQRATCHQALGLARRWLYDDPHARPFPVIRSCELLAQQPLIARRTSVLIGKGNAGHVRLIMWVVVSNFLLCLSLIPFFQFWF
jgi:hypothetical protein